MRAAISGPSTIQVGGLCVSGDGEVPRQAGFLDMPCSMLARDLAAFGSERWTPVERGYLLRAPKGSVAVVDSQDADEVVIALRTAGPKCLQVFAAALALRSIGTREFSAVDLYLSRHGSGDLSFLLRAMSRVQVLSGPAPRRGARVEPGSPLRQLNGNSSAGLFALSDEWLVEFSAKDCRVAKLPASFLELHAKNDRYTILLAWHLAIMLRVNRKYGYHYRVTLRTLLEGAGIDVPRRNVGRFLAAIYRSLEAIPGVRVSAPLHTLYACGEILDSKFSFSATPELVAAYATS